MSKSQKNQERRFFLVDDLLRSRGILCEWCKEIPWVNKHHAIFRRDNRFPQLDVPENLMCVCKRCHESGEVDTNKASITFYFIQKSRGYDMDTWILALPLKIKPNFLKYKMKEFDPSEPLSKLTADKNFE